MAEEVICGADGILLNKSPAFNRGPLPNMSRTIDTNGKNGVVEWKQEAIDGADGTVIGRSASFVPLPLKGVSRAIDTEGKNGVVVWQKKS